MDNNEILFWKVFKNQYILKLILKIIEIQKWNIKYYDDKKQLYYRSNNYHNDLNTLKWYLLKDKDDDDEFPIELLKYKLRKTSNESEFEISKESINLLFNFGHSNCNDNNNNNNNHFYDKNKSYIENQIEINKFHFYSNKIIIDEILKSILNFKLNEIIENCGDLVYELLNSKRIGKRCIPIEIYLRSFQILINKPYNLPILSKSLELIITEYPIQFLESISNLNNNLFISQKFKENSILYANENKDENVIEFILNNSKFYEKSPKSLNSKINPNLFNKSKFIENKLISLNYFKSLPTSTNNNNIKKVSSTIVQPSPSPSSSNNNDTIDQWNSLINDKITHHTHWSKQFLINDEKKINWIYKNYKSSKSLNLIMDKCKLNLFSYQSIDLLNYSIEKFKNLPKLSIISPSNIEYIESIYSYLFENSLSNCNIELLNTIYNQTEIKLNQDKILFKFFKYNSNFKILDGGGCEKVLKFLNFLNLNKFKLFSNQLFKLFIRKVINYLESSGGDYSIQDIKINFNLFEYHSMNLFYETITSLNQFDFSPKLIEIMFNNNFNPIIMNKEFIIMANGGDSVSGDSDVFSSYLNNSNLYTDENSSSLFKLNYINQEYKLTYSISIENLNKLISILLLILNNTSTSTSATSTSSIMIIQEIELICNYLFKRIIRCKDCNIEIIRNVYKFINSKFNLMGFKFNLEHSLYHSFYYLLNRSTRLIKFILECTPEILNDLKDNFYFFYNYQYYKNNGINDKSNNYLNNNLNITQFNFNFIIGDGSNQIESTIEKDEELFELILNKLIENLINLPIENSTNSTISKLIYNYNSNKDYFYNQYSILNSTLIYLLEINKPILFFNQFKFIKKYLNSLLNNQDLEYIEFNYTLKLLNLISIKFNNDKKSLLKLLKFRNYESIRNLILIQEGDQELIDNLLLKNSNLINNILINIYKLFNNETIITKYWDKVINCNEKLLLKYSNYLITNNNNNNRLISLTQLKLIFIEFQNNVKLMNLYFKQFKIKLQDDDDDDKEEQEEEQEEYQFIISKQQVLNVINNENLNLLKLYLDYNLINNSNDSFLKNNQQYQDLLKFLKK